MRETSRPAFTACFLYGSAIAETINFSCSGVFIAEGYDPSPREVFDLTVDTATGELFGFRNSIAPGCIDKRPGTFKVSIDDRSATMSCDNSMATTSLTISRATGHLSIFTQWKKTPSHKAFVATGEADFTKVERKVF